MSSPIEKCSDLFVETTIDEEVVLLDLDSADFFSLTWSALGVWLQIDGIRDSAAIAARLHEEYGGDAAEIAADTQQFLDELRATGFIRHG